VAPVAPPAKLHRRHWREYKTDLGKSPVRGFLMGLDVDDRAEVIAAMKEVAIVGLKAARHLRGDIHEVRADGKDQIYRVLFATEGRFSQVLLSLDGFSKKTQRTPPDKIALAEKRLSLWRARGKSTKKSK
jgi:phage-related protein